MLGDAAHPMTPFLGQGACIAIEDALVLGRAFEASANVHEALNRYEAARKDSGHQCSTSVARGGAGIAGSFEAATLARSTEVSLRMIPCLHLFDFAALASKVIQ